MDFVGKPSERRYPASHERAVDILRVFAEHWDLTLPFPAIRREFAEQIAIVALNGTWERGNKPLLQKHAKNLRAAGYTPWANNVQSAIPQEDNVLTRVGKVLGSILFFHPLVWAILILVYPRSRTVQAIFFWNPRVRRLVGLGYIQFLLTWVPFLRRKLFAPFRDSLLSDSDLANFSPDQYFADSIVKMEGSEDSELLRTAIPIVQEQIILEGDSGLGKSMFLRHLVMHSPRLIVYLPADKCANGVMEAIQAKLHGPAQDKKFLQSLIFSGAIDICVDGLNEVSAETRAKVNEFVEHYFKGNIILTTQPFEWKPPSTAKTYTLQPLSREQIEQFLLSRWEMFSLEASISYPAYELACRNYLAETFNKATSKEELASNLRILSNPMDLTVVANMLFLGEQPDLYHLQDQQYQVMATDYERVNIGQHFPLDRFSEHVYQMRLEDKVQLSQDEFPRELQCMERHKMVVMRQNEEPKDSVKAWFFRHDKIMEFFIARTFLGDQNERISKHVGDARFRGVYLLLAMLLPADAALILRDRLVEYAADTKDHTISDLFVQGLRSRKVEEFPGPAS